MKEISEWLAATLIVGFIVIALTLGGVLISASAVLLVVAYVVAVTLDVLNGLRLGFLSLFSPTEGRERTREEDDE